MFNSRKKQKARAEQISNNLVPGARVMTNFGLFGTVTDIDDDGIKVTIESGPGTTIVVHRQAIGQIEPPESAVTDGEPAAEPGVVDAAGASVADDAPADQGRITDAELDAMNAERARRGDGAADDTAEGEAAEGSAAPEGSSAASDTTASDSAAGDSASGDSAVTGNDAADIDEADVEEIEIEDGETGKRRGDGPEPGTV